MAEYREIQGAAVQSLASSTGTIEGQIWYDNVNGAFKLESVATASSWASGASTPVGTSQGAAAGTYLAGIMFGGNTPAAPSPLSTQSLTYNGSSWTATSSLNTGRGGIASANRGTENSTLAFQGNTDNGPTYASNLSEEWNGSTWAAVNTVNTPSSLAGGTGIVTAALCVGGELAGPAYGNSSRTEEYDGTCWAAQTGRPASIRNHSLFGPQNDAISCMGIDYTTTAQEWSGTAWTAGGVNNTARRGTNDGTGSGTAGLVAGGQAPGSPAGITATELYDGTSWTSSPASLSTGKFDCATFGTDANAVSATGRTPTALTTVEEWTGIGAPTTQTLTTT
tara:strand:+ start:354 stop:1364 length:1011 start_codon:yes stop_codon:yes gene_type:complete